MLTIKQITEDTDKVGEKAFCKCKRNNCKSA